MLILHISDIHFRHPACSTPDLDPDRPYRTKLVQDARAHVEQWGTTVDVILIGGDIAFRGAKEEYTAALAWIYELADACGCKRERIFVIPGNHDVDRSIIVHRLSVRNAQQAIVRASNPERELAEQFTHKETGDALLAPLSAYNDFAALFQCQVFTPERLYWHQDLPLGEGVSLRIYGLTSTLLSGAGAPQGQDDNRESLYLSPLQTVLDPVDNVVNLVMCHHPPDWFKDNDAVADAIEARASIHVFGHKHRQRIARDAQYIRFSAGAVNPDRYEAGWEPGYNLFRLTLGKAGANHYLDIEAHVMSWQTNPDRFRPKQDEQGREVFLHRIMLRNIRPQNAVAEVAEVPIPVVPPFDAEAAMGEERTRNIVLRFWSLASSQRREISERLHLLEDGEMTLPEAERYGRVLIRAGKRNQLNELAGEIERMEGR